MATRPGFIWSGTEWVSIGQEAVVAPVAYQASAPSSPATGDIWIDSDDDVPSVNSTLYYRWKKTMSGGETSVSGTDDNSLTLAYTAGYESVFINGVLQVRGSDYTATTGTSVTGMTALTAGDVVMVESVVAYSVGDTYTQSTLDGKFSPITTTGMVLLSSTTIGSAVTTVTVNNAFSADYDNYIIKLFGTNGSVNDTDIRLKLNNSAGGTYNYGGTVTNNSGTNAVISGNNLSTGFYFGLTGANSQTSLQCDLYSPFLVRYTSVISQGWGGTYGVTIRGADNNAASQTGFTVSVTTGTITGGTIKVYGYK